MAVASWLVAAAEATDNTVIRMQSTVLAVSGGSAAGALTGLAVVIALGSGSRPGDRRPPQLDRAVAVMVVTVVLSAMVFALYLIALIPAWVNWG